MRTGIVGNQFTLFTYSIKHLPHSDKVRFYYVLKGRNGKEGILKTYNIEQLAKTVLFVPNISVKDVDAFLALWKCPYKKKEVVLRA